MAVWFSFSSETSLFFAFLGSIGSVSTIFICNKMGLFVNTKKIDIICIIRFILYFFWIVKEVFKSAIDVSKRVWDDKLTSNSGFCTIAVPKTSQFGLIAFANSVTLTPGTITVHLTEDELTIHTLDTTVQEAMIEGNDVMIKKINKFANRNDTV